MTSRVRQYEDRPDVEEWTRHRVEVQSWAGRELVGTTVLRHTPRTAVRVARWLARRERAAGLTGRVWIERDGHAAWTAVYPPGQPARFGPFERTTRVVREGSRA